MIVEHDGRTFALGRLIEESHDPANRAYPAQTARLRKVSWTRHGEAFDQGQVRSCTGNALAGWFNTEGGGWREDRPLATETDAVGLYSAGTRLDGIRGVYPPEDTGSTGPAVCKAAWKAGRLSGYAHAFGLDHLLGALMLGPCLVGTVWLRGMFDPDPDGRVPLTGDPVGGHEYEAVGYDPATGLIECWNSWGPGWGVGGRFYVRADAMDWLLRQHGDVTVPAL